MKISEPIFDYLKRVLVCLLASIGCPVGYFLCGLSTYLYAAIMFGSVIPPVTFSKILFGQVLFNFLIGIFFAFPIMAVYLALINSALKFTNKETYINVIAIPLAIYIALAYMYFGNNSEVLNKAGISIYYVVLYSAICANLYWYFIKKFKLTVGKNAL